jgi:hypothetical protein
MKNIPINLAIFFTLPSLAGAAIVSFEAESGSLGSAFTIENGALNASGDAAIVPIDINDDFTTDQPTSAAHVVTYNVTFDTADTYDLWFRVGTDRGSAINSQDSVFTAARFGVIDTTSDSPADWTSMNRFRITQDEFIWFNVSAGDAPTSSGYNRNSTTFNVAAAGDQTWQLGGREENFRIDAIAFVSTNEFDGLTALEATSRLDASLIPEPSSTMLLGLVSIALLGRRRRA